jgi:hypothetical protein
MVGTNRLDETVGLLKRGTIVKYLPDRGIMRVRLNNAPALKGQQALPVDVQAPHSMFYNNGLFIGTAPIEGTPVVVGQGSGGEYLFVSFLAEDLLNVPNVQSGVLLLSSNDDTRLTLDVKNNIYIGSSINNIHIDTNKNFLSSNFYSNYNFTQASRKVKGPIKRDLVLNTQFTQENKLEFDDYESFFKIVAMDPSTSPTDVATGSTKNPPFVEDRELVYEFQYLSEISEDLVEATKYSESNTTTTSIDSFTFPNRRASRADTLSLSLVSPNFLMETVKGTVVDIFGNILDLNRNPLPVGQGQNTIDPDRSSDKVTSFKLIKELERKSLAYHFELNARKDLRGQSASDIVNTSTDYARNRSRFFFDVDKEGQFKLNVPASSERGNIPLLTRYENYSTFGTDEPGNVDMLVFRNDNKDIYPDSFASPSLTAVSDGFLPAADGSRGSISIISPSDGYGAPEDRLTQQVIKHGVVYHDILQTCFTHQNNQYLDYQAGTVDPLTVDISESAIPALKNVVSQTIITSGDKANAGGRSGSINFDGSLELNVGANTVDRQSLWLDTAGGVVANIGRDINGRSVVASTGGDFFLQVGGFGVMGDSRFVDQNNGIKGAVLDLRILGSGGFCHMIRIDDSGVSIMSPGQLKLHAKKDLTITSDKNIRIDCETLIMQGRMHLKEFGGSS